MEKIITKKQFIESLKDVLAVEKTARDIYKKDMIKFNDFKIVNTINKIEKDEEMHILIVEELIKMLEKN